MIGASMLSKELDQNQIDVLLICLFNYREKFYRTNPNSDTEHEVYKSLVKLGFLTEAHSQEYTMTELGIETAENLSRRIRFSLVRDHYFALNTSLIDGINIPAHCDENKDLEEIILKNGWKIQITPNGINVLKPDAETIRFIHANSVQFSDPI